MTESSRPNFEQAPHLSATMMSATACIHAIPPFAALLITSGKSPPSPSRIGSGSRGSLDVPACTAIASMLAGLPHLEALNLFNNQLGPSAAVALAPGLARLACLRSLSLGFALIGAPAAPALGQALKCMHDLREVRVRHPARRAPSLSPSLAQAGGG